MWGVASAPPKISHAIPLQVLQLLKSERWNSAVFGVLQGVVARELHAKLGAWERDSGVAGGTRRAYCAARLAGPTVLRAPSRLLRRLLGLSRLARRLLGAGVRLDFFGGEGALRGAATVGALPRNGEAVARAEARQVDADDEFEAIGALGLRAQLEPQVRRRRDDVETPQDRTLAVEQQVSAARLVPRARDLVCHVADELLAVARGPLRGNGGHGNQGVRGLGR